MKKSGKVGELDALVASWGERPSWDEYFISAAVLIASRSTCARLNVGCVMVSSGEHKHRIIAAGYNGFIAGAPHSSHIRDGHEVATVHAEQNAISDAARRGVSLSDSVAYVTHFPCLNCAKLMLSAGVRRVKYLHDYNNDPLVLELFGQVGAEIEKLEFGDAQVV